LANTSLDPNNVWLPLLVSYDLAPEDLEFVGAAQADQISHLELFPTGAPSVFSVVSFHCGLDICVFC
jgi:hypothetical protein